MVVGNAGDRWSGEPILNPQTVNAFEVLDVAGRKGRIAAERGSRDDEIRVVNTCSLQFERAFQLAELRHDLMIGIDDFDTFEKDFRCGLVLNLPRRLLYAVLKLSLNHSGDGNQIVRFGEARSHLWV